MNPGDSAPDASRSELDEVSRPGTVAGYGIDKPAWSPRTHKPLQDIQDIIDKLAVVTQQLRRPGSGVPDPSH
jgi:hypothetical protein